MSDHDDIVREAGTYASIAVAQGWPETDAEEFIAGVRALVAERDEAQEALQSLAADHYFARAEQAEARVARLEEALRGMLDVQLRSMPGVNPDGSVSTSSMAETLALAALAFGSEGGEG